MAKRNQPAGGPPPAPQKKSNITRFRQDKRLMVVGGLRSVALLGMLATVIYCIWNYREDINLANMRRVISYVQALGVRGEEGAVYPFESGLQSLYKPFGAGLAVAGPDGFRFVSGVKGGDYDMQLGYANPAMDVYGGRALLYDRGGKGLSIHSSYACLNDASLDSPILWAELGADGGYCVVTDENGYRSAVTLYDRKFHQKYKWQTSKHYVAMACPRPDGRGFAALCLQEKAGSINFMIRGYSVTEEEPVFEIDLGAEKVYSMKYHEGGALVLVRETGVYLYNGKGEEQGRSPHDAGSLVRFVHKGGQMPVLVCRTGDAGEWFVVRSLDKDGKVLCERKYEGALRDFDWDGGQAAMLFSHKLVVADMEDGEKPEWELDEVNARGVAVRGDGRPLLIYADRAELAQPPGSEPEKAGEE